MSQTVELVLFEIAGVRYASDLTQVRRIGVVEPEQSVGHPLGKPTLGRRALVFSTTVENREVESQLCVDAVLGVHAVSVDDVRRLPLAAAVSPFTVGAWVEGSKTVLLVDLHATSVASSRGNHDD